MASPSIRFLLAACGSLTLPCASALACEDDTTRWKPERSWPTSCETDVPTDGFVLVAGDALAAGTAGGEGPLEVAIERVEDGVPVETFPGMLSYPDGTSALFHTTRPLAPSASYVLSAVRIGPDGQPLGARFTSAFTTGTRTLPPLRFASTVSATVEEGERDIEECVADACGDELCEATGETVRGQLVRVAVPALEGGLSLKPYSLHAELTERAEGEQAEVVATSKPFATQAGEPTYVVLHVPPHARETQGCVTVHVTDIGGHQTASEPVCFALAPFPSSDADSSDEAALLYARSGGDEDEGDRNARANAAAGCAVTAGTASASQLGWLALVLMLVRLRWRRRMD